MTIYLDHAATTSIRPEAIEAATAVLASGNGNASGTHAVARSAKNLLEHARERAAAVVGASRSDEVVFTSGGTESDNLAIVGAGLAGKHQTIVGSSIEHKAVLEPARRRARFGHRVVEIPCNADGGFDAAEREMPRSHPRVKPISLGPRILRGETAAIAATALWMGNKGDWNN